jgi:hypothetical protein
VATKRLESGANCFTFRLLRNRGFCQGSSVVEQGTHKPLVGSSTLPPGTYLERSQRLPDFVGLSVSPGRSPIVLVLVVVLDIWCVMVLIRY